ncbi:trypsin-like serine peptidase [Mesorhizobium caraganae]|uniref:trypsin-like serine peptidase n=1 Tax=Mesorhizobium caraganae TaxID=483206 RepID=UPI0033377589
MRTSALTNISKFATVLKYNLLGGAMLDENVAKIVFAIGKVEASGLTPLGTAFAISPRLMATAAHVVGVEATKIVAVMSTAQTLSTYQDTTVNQFQNFPVNVVEHDAVRDISILETHEGLTLPYINNALRGTDLLSVNSSIISLGFPHLDFGRLVLTAHQSNVGGRVLLGAGGIKTKHAILNTQTRPGQSGGPVFRTGTTEIVAMIIGSYVPAVEGFAIVGGINPQTLHQTTHAISAEYISDMIK